MNPTTGAAAADSMTGRILSRNASPFLTPGSLGSSGFGKILIVIAGQSNATTHAFASTLTDTTLDDAYANVRMLSKQAPDPVSAYQEDGPQSMAALTFNGGIKVGFETTLMRDLDRARPSGFAVVRYAIGGASSADWDTYKTAFFAYVLAAKVTLGCTRIAVVWEQGEADARNGTLAANYATWLGTFVTSIRANLGALVPFIYGKLNLAVDGVFYAFKTELRAAQVAFDGSMSLVQMVDQDSVGLTDNAHYSADGYASVGHLFSPVVASHVGVKIPPEASFSSDPTGLPVAFTDTSTALGGTIAAWAWTFGDGATSTLQNPSNTYASTGTYSVSLTVTDSAGSTHSTTSSVLVVGGYSGVSRDSASLVYVPRTSAQWTTFLSAIGSSMIAPSGIWLCQETSGSIIDKAGTIDLALAGAASTYRQAVTNWTRLAITQTDGSAKHFVSTDTGLPDLSTTSMMTLAFVLFPSSAPSSDYGVVAQGVGANRSAVILKLAGTAQALSPTSNGATGASHIDGIVHPVITKVDRTNSTCVGYTDLSKMTPTFGAGMTGKLLAIGAQPAALLSAATGFLYVASWYGVGAEVTDAQVKVLLQGLGFTVTAWS